MQQENLSLYHLVRQPKTPSSKAPLLIMLHGYGSNEQDLFSFAGELPEDLFIISLRAPVRLEQSGFAWFEINWSGGGSGKYGDDQQALASRDAVANFIDEAVANNAQIIACSALLTTTMREMESVVEAVREANLGDKIKVMIGGAPVTETFKESIGADYYTQDAATAAEVALKICTGA